MPDFLVSPFSAAGQLPPLEVAVRLLVALLLGGGVSLIYRLSRRGAELDSSFAVTLALLCVLIAMVTQVIGESVARAFGLVGALSIVRFRTAVRDTQDTAYVIFAVAVGMAVGASSLWVAILGIAAVVLAEAAAGGFTGRTPVEYTLTLRTDSSCDLDGLARRALQDVVSRLELRSLRSGKQGAYLEGIYRLRPRTDIALPELVERFDAAGGVQSVQLEPRELNGN